MRVGPCERCGADGRGRLYLFCPPCRKQHIRERVRTRYDECKQAGVCVDCTAPLQPEDGKRVQCVDCRDRNRANTVRYIERNRTEYNKRKNEYARQRYREDVEASRAKYRAARFAKKLAGICLDCASPCSANNLRCPYHASLSAGYSRKSWRKKNPTAQHRKNNPPPSLRARVKPAAEPAVGRMLKSEITQYRPTDEAGQMSRPRLLRAMRWLDWSNSTEILAVLNIEEGTRTKERNALQQALSRLVGYGLAERRNRVGMADYRLSTAGRAEADRLRGGGSPSVRARRSA